MTIAVRYFSVSGNTKKVAQAIASALGVEAMDVASPLQEKVDVLFLGSAVYAFGVDPAVSEFIEKNASKIGKIVNFSTAALVPSTYRLVKKIAKKNNVAMADEEFHCRGRFKMMHRNRPDENDLSAAKDFALALMK